MGVVLAGCAEAPERTEAAAQPIKGGVDDSDHLAVFAVISNVNLPSGELCTGTLIAPNLILTARHCTGPVTGSSRCGTDKGDMTGVDTSGPSFTPDAFLLLNAQNSLDPSLNDATVAKVINPDPEGGVVCGHDVSLLQLTTPIEGVEIIAPRLDLGPIAGESFTAIGYGLDGATANSQGYRRSLAGAAVKSLGPVSQGGQLRASENDWIADKGPCGGDSGSPAVDVAGRSIGVMSRGNPTVCTSMIYTRVDPFADWLRQAAIQASAEAGIAAPAWTKKPADGSAKFGDDCSTEAQCAAGLVCLPFTDGFHCSTTDCSACPQGAMCGESLGKPACVVTPTPMPDGGAETSSSGSGGATGSSTSTGSSMATGSSTSSGTPGEEGGCGVAKAPADPRGGALAWITAAAGLSWLRRRRAASERRRSGRRDG